jgi:hypothetical protein
MERSKKPGNQQDQMEEVTHAPEGATGTKKKKKKKKNRNQGRKGKEII